MKNGVFCFIYRTLILILLISAQGFSQNTEAQKSGEESICGQESKLSFSYGMDLVSRYIWRGVDWGESLDGSSSPHFQPTAAFSYNFGKAGSLSLGVWGSYAFTGNYNENDIFLTYTVNTKSGNFMVTLNDYYFPYENIPVTNFDGKGEGAHTIEASGSYTFPEVFPLTLYVSANVHNNIPDDKTLYIEASYPFTVGETQLGVFVGAAQGESIWHKIYSERFEFNNIGLKASKSIKITQDYSLPVGLNWIYNAHLKKTYIVFKVTI